jgi:hypothetical protein
MHTFVETYGGPARADGAIRQFTVQAENIDEAIAIGRWSPRVPSFQRFEIVNETPNFDRDQPSTIEQGDGP